MEVTHMSETVVVDRITVELSGELQHFVESGAAYRCISKEAFVCLALSEYYDHPRLDVGDLLRILKP
jgi:hypothetical protein